MIGIDISDRSIKIAEVTDGENRQLKTVGWMALPANLMRRGVILDVVAVKEVLRVALTKCAPVPLAGSRVVVSIPEVQSFVRVLELPEMSQSEMAEAVQWAIRQHIPFDLDRVYLDWQSLTSDQVANGHQHVLVGAAQRDVVNPLLEVIDGLGLVVMALELEAQALVRSLLPLDQQAQDIHGVLLVDLGATSTNVIYFDQGAMRFTTSIQRGGDDLTQQLAQELQLQPNIAAEKKALVGVKDATTSDVFVATTLRAATLQLVQQINQIAEEVTSQFSPEHGLRTILLAGGTANLPGLISVFAEVFPGVPVQIGNPWVNLTMVEEKNKAPVLAKIDATHFTTAIGLALRQMERL